MSKDRWHRYHPQVLTNINNKLNGRKRAYEAAKRDYEAAKSALLEVEEELEAIYDMKQRELDLLEKIFQEVCFEHDILADTVRGRARHKNVVNCRSELCYRLATETTLGYVEIGRFLNLDHASVMYQISRWANHNALPDPTNDVYGRRVRANHGLVPA